MNKRYERQQEIVIRQDISVAVIGVGAGGRQVALQLGAMGISPITLVDFDKVDDVNLAAQGFYENDIGQFKVDAVRRVLRQINSQIDVRVYRDIYDPSAIQSEVVFACVDSIDVRKYIYEQEKAKGVCKLIIDGRMASELSQVYRVDLTDETSCKWYETTFFPAHEAFPARCTAKTTIYCANINAGMMISEFTRWIRNIHIVDKLSYNIVGCDFEAVAADSVR